MSSEQFRENPEKQLDAVAQEHSDALDKTPVQPVLNEGRRSV